MKFSSFAVVSLFFIALGLVSISPEIRLRSAVADIPKAEPRAEFQIAEASVVRAEESSETVTDPVISVQQSSPPPRKSVASVPKQNVAASGAPIQLSIPAISLTSPVISVSTNAQGQMDVPDGSTNNVGWYKHGVIPGEVGSAVMDAHVFAAFKNLRSLKIGDDVYVKNEAGTRLHFIVREIRVYPLNEMTPDMLFRQTNARQLNLITCAGSLTSDRTTYDHRLVVYTELVP